MGYSVAVGQRCQGGVILNFTNKISLEFVKENYGISANVNRNYQFADFRVCNILFSLKLTCKRYNFIEKWLDLVPFVTDLV